MAGAFLLPALSPEDGIPVVQAGSCSAALHCDELSTDVFLLSLLLTLPVLLFSPACLQLWCSSFLNMSSTFVLLFSIQFMCALFESFLLVRASLCTCAHIFLLCCICCYYTYDETTNVDVSRIISKTASKMLKLNQYIFSGGRKDIRFYVVTLSFDQVKIQIHSSNNPTQAIATFSVKIIFS